jgi:hypothetical protein
LALSFRIWAIVTQHSVYLCVCLCLCLCLLCCVDF